MELSRFVNYWLAGGGFKIKQALLGISIHPRQNCERPGFSSLVSVSPYPFITISRSQLYLPFPTLPRNSLLLGHWPSAPHVSSPQTPVAPHFQQDPWAPLLSTFPLLQIRTVFPVKSLLSVNVSLSLVKDCNLIKSFEELAKWSYFNRYWVTTVCCDDL